MATKPEQEAAAAGSPKPTLKQRLIAATLPARTWVAAHRWQSAAIGGGVLLLVGAATAWTVVAQIRSAGEEQISLKMAYEALDLGAYAEARRLASKMRSQGVVLPNELGGPAFVLGTAKLLETDDEWGKGKKSNYLVASRYLEEASDRGFPKERLAEGLYMLGKSLYLSDQFAACRLYLHDALEANPNRKTEIHKLLAGAYRHDANPKLDEALDHITQHLEDRTLSPADRAEATLEKSRILYDLGEIEQCRQSLDEVLSEVKNRAGAITMQGRLLLDEARALKKDPQLVASGENEKQSRAKYEEAIKTFSEAQGYDTLDGTVTPTSMYLIGVCQMEMGDTEASHAQLARTTKLYKETHEGLAAGLLAADLLRGLDRYEESVAAYRTAMVSAGTPDSYSNRWVSLDKFRERILDALQYFLENDQFELALKLMEKFSPLVSKLRTIELEAETHRAWANSLLASVADLSDEQSEEIAREARSHLRRAGQIYANLARRRTATRHYPNDLWNSAANLIAGQDYSGATKALEEYLTIESRARRARALLSLGIASLSMGNVEKSLKALNECIIFHTRDAAVYEARLWGAKAYIEKGDSAQAEALLIANLTEDNLTPSSREWRESLFELGYILHASSKHEEAIKKLEEAVARYPDSPQVYKGLYTIGESYRAAARVPQARLEEVTIESVRLEVSKQIRQLLNGSLRYYTQLQQRLNRRQEEASLTTLEKAMLRNCYMAQGSVRSDLGRYESAQHYTEAIKAYSTVSTHYQNEPIVLEAFVQIAHCYRRLNRPVEARGAVEQAKVVLNRLPYDAPFTKTTNYEREQWSRLLAQLSVW